MSLKVDLRALRFDKGWNLRRAAKEFRISESLLSMVERDLRIPGPEIAKRIADAYELTPLEVWDLTSKPPEREAA